MSCGCLHYEKMRKRNEYTEREDCYEIFIGNKNVLIDKDDYDKISKYCWCINGTGYVIAWSPNEKRMINMARTILSVKDSDVYVDHINGNTLDNRKNNLRKVDCQKNNMNQNLSKNNTSGHKGVHWHKGVNKWIANIGLNGKLLHLGYFENFDDAVSARESKEKEMYGEYSRSIEYKS